MKGGICVPKLKGPWFCQQPAWGWTRILNLETSERNTAVPTLWLRPCKPHTWVTSLACHVSDLQNCEIINLCCFKLLSLWYFVMAAIKANTSCLDRNYLGEKYFSLWTSEVLLYSLPASSVAISVPSNNCRCCNFNAIPISVPFYVTWCFFFFRIFSLSHNILKFHSGVPSIHSLGWAPGGTFQIRSSL